MINRAAILLKYKKPAIDWINSANPFPQRGKVTLDEVNEERTIYLIRDEDADTPDITSKWVRLNFKLLFESELYNWYVDDSLWPKKRTYKMFQEWFDVECHTVIEDLVGGQILDDDMQEVAHATSQ